MSAFHFPQPGERQNAAAILVPEAVLCNVLYLAVVATRDSRCDDAECPDCHNNRLSCWLVFRLLGQVERDRLDDWLRREEHISPSEWRR